MKPIKDYILIPLWTADPPFSKNPKSSHDDGFKPSSNDGKKVDEDPSKRNECNDQENEDNVNSTNNVNSISLTVNAAGTNRVNAVGELLFDPDMPALEDIGTFDFLNEDEDDDAVAGMSNLDTTIQVSPTPTIRIHKDHPLDQVIKDLQSATQTRNMTKNLKEHRFISTIQQRTNNKDLQSCLSASFLSQGKPKKALNGFLGIKDERGIIRRNKARLVTQGHTQEEGIDYDEVFASIARIEVIRLFLAYASFKDFMVYQMDVKRYQVNPKVSYFHAVKKIFRYLKGQPKLGLWYPKDPPFDLVAYNDNDYAGASLDKKSTTGDGKEIIITESSVRKDLRLTDEEGVACLPNSTIFENLKLIGMLMGEGSTLPTDPQHTPTILQSSSSQPQKTQKPRKLKRKNTQVPRPSSSTKNVTDEAVHKDCGDRLVRAATTAFSLEAEQDSRNIDKTQSKATLNEANSSKTTLGGGPRGNTLQSDKDRMKLNELMELCTNLQSRVLDLEKTKTTQALKITSLKRRVKKLEKNLGEDASKQGRKINDIDVDKDITLVNDQDDAEMFNVNDLHGERCLLKKKLLIKRLAREKAKKELEANISLIKEWDDIQAKIDADYQLAQRLETEKQEELKIEEKDTLFKELLEKRKKHFAAKEAEEKRNKPPTQAQQKESCVLTSRIWKERSSMI
uniref:Reverse transcriptase Ty1/copia-type domain-containing protein n=1 Tax=Tanacetum cinerariifolium TaxID=118510 RepID=A0A6L2J0K8_TANCI|nr:hypothetical protein [Tanacetum cinerariifolium]